MGFFLDSNQYTHPPIEDQLDLFNVRSFEFDVFDDRPGGKFVDRPVRAILVLDDVIDTSPEMEDAGVLFQASFAPNAQLGASSAKNEKRVDARRLPLCDSVLLCPHAPLKPQPIHSKGGRPGAIFTWF